MKTVENRHVAQ